jgi:hypothetical protein
MTDPEMMVNLGDLIAPMKDCSWLLINPVGHVQGVLSGDCAVTGDEAFRHFESDARDRRRQREWGFRMELIPLTEFETRARQCMLGKCDHPEPPGLKTCKLCGRVGKADFQTHVIDGKPMVRCRADVMCRRRRLIRYGRG